MATRDKVICGTPTPGKKTTRIDRWKYDLIRAAILAVLPPEGEGVAFEQLPDVVAARISQVDRARLGSIRWYTTTVKLALEVQGEIRRVPGAIPQRLLRSAGRRQG